MSSFQLNELYNILLCAVSTFSCCSNLIYNTIKLDHSNQVENFTIFFAYWYTKIAVFVCVLFHSIFFSNKETFAFGAVVVVIVWLLDLQLLVQSVPITINQRLVGSESE
jgi:hypothetical protein